MNNTLEMRDLTAAEIDSVAAAGGGISITGAPSISTIIAPQINIASVNAISIFGDATAYLGQANGQINGIQSKFHLG